MCVTPCGDIQIKGGVGAVTSILCSDLVYIMQRVSALTKSQLLGTIKKTFKDQLHTPSLEILLCYMEVIFM